MRTVCFANLLPADQMLLSNQKLRYGLSIHVYYAKMTSSISNAFIKSNIQIYLTKLPSSKSNASNKSIVKIWINIQTLQFFLTSSPCMATQFERKLGKDTNTPNWGNYSSLDMYLARHRGKLARFRSPIYIVKS